MASAGKLRLSVDELGVDMLSISAHKMHGPKGVGALYLRKGTPLRPVLEGGGQEDGLRPGTHDVPAIVGFGEAARLAVRNLEEERGYVEALTQRLEAGIRRIASDAVVLGHGAPRLPNTLCVCFPGRQGDQLVAALDVRGVSVSTGAACTTERHEPSHVLAAMGVEPALASGALRFSLGSGNAREEIDLALAALRAVLRDGERTRDRLLRRVVSLMPGDRGAGG